MAIGSQTYQKYTRIYLFVGLTLVLLYPTSRSDRIDPKEATHKRLTRQVKPVLQHSRKPLAKHVPSPFFWRLFVRNIE